MADPVRGAAGRLRRAGAVATSVLAVLVLWGLLIVPDRLDGLRPGDLVRLPLEGLALAGLVLVLPPRSRPVAAGAGGALVGLLAVVKALDTGFSAEVGRPFDPVADWGAFGPAIGVVRDSVGGAGADVAVLAAGLLVVAVVGGCLVSALRLSRVAGVHRRGSARAVGALGVVWVVTAVLGVQVVPGVPLASRGTADLAVARIRAAAARLQDQARFRSLLAAPDPYAALPSADLLGGLRGKDVIIAFVESYGRVAVQGSTIAPGVARVLAAGTDALAAAGFSSRSAFLTSPTFGGISWLAHSTLQSGLWVDGQQRYDSLVTSGRFTLSDAFDQAGWRTVGDVPANTRPWPEGRTFYHYDQLYDAHDVGYAGPKFSYASMPDQYTLAAFARRELSPGHQPVMAEIDLVSSHAPWTPLPHMVDASRIGDGSVFAAMPAQGLTPKVAWRDPATVSALYGESIQYSLTSLISFVTTVHDDDLVLVLLGDHQPAAIVSGPGAGHDVPVTVVAHDPAVLDRISSWGWVPGMLPAPRAPVWRMDAFRDRFLSAFGASSSGPVAPAAAPAPG